jgi:hypothetical protein
LAGKTSRLPAILLPSGVSQHAQDVEILRLSA